jgi:hypothetical protein
MIKYCQMFWRGHRKSYDAVNPIPLCFAGNWTGEGRFKMWFNRGGAIEFGQAMLHAGKMGKFLF